MKNTMYPKFLDAVKVLLRGKFVVLNIYIRKEERSKLSCLKK